MKYRAMMSGAPAKERNTQADFTCFEPALEWATLMRAKYPKAKVNVYQLFWKLADGDQGISGDIAAEMIARG